MSVACAETGAAGSMKSARSISVTIRLRTKRSPAKVPSIRRRPGGGLVCHHGVVCLGVTAHQRGVDDGSPMSASARGRSAAFTLTSRSVVSLIPVMDHRSALTLTGGSHPFSRLHANVQPLEQNRACSNTVPRCSNSGDQSPGPSYALTSAPALGGISTPRSM
jgi:hypothetical protein